MRKTNDKKKLKFKKIGTATALTITLVTFNVSTLAHATELDTEVNVNTTISSVENQEVETQLETEVNTASIVENEDRKTEIETNEANIVENVDSETEVEAEVNATSIVETEESKQEEIAQAAYNQSKANNFDINEWDAKSYSKYIILDKYIGSDTDIVIPAEDNGRKIKIGTKDCFSNVKDTVTSITFEEVAGTMVESPTSLIAMFENYTALENVDLSGLDTSTVTNMSYMFRGCTNLKTVKFGDKFDTSLTTNMNSMFSGCTNLINLDLDNFNTELVENMSYMFDGCSSLTNLNLSSFNTEQVENMRYMFNKCSSLTSLDLANFNTEKVINMDNMFNECNSLTDLNVTSFDTKLVTSMINLFNGCKLLTTIDVKNFDTSQVNKMNNMFKDCSLLTDLDLSSFDTSQVTNMSYMFMNTLGLKNIDFGNTFNTSLVEDMKCMFKSTGMENLDLSGFDTSNVINMQGMFYNTQSLKNIDFGNTFNTSLVKNMSYMFCNSALDSLDLSGFDTAEVTDMKLMFARLDNITILDLSNFNFDKVTVDNMEYMFGNIAVDAQGNIVENNSSTTAKQLLVVSRDAKLETYNFAADFRLPVGPTVNANGGEFANGDTVSSVLKTNVVEHIDEAYIDKLIQDSLLAVQAPTRDGYTFVSWEAKPTTNILDKLNNIYYAKWDVKNNPSQGGSVVTPGGNVSSSSDVATNQGSTNGTDSTVQLNSNSGYVKTGDAGALGYFGLCLTSILGIFVSMVERKNKFTK